MQKTQVVIGHLFGDEGKGATVQYLCKEALRKAEQPLVVCFSGGPQNAHTVNDGTREHICASFGSGILLGVPTYHSEQYYVDPLCVLNEARELEYKGVHDAINMFSQNCRVITPFDVEAGRANKKVQSDGTCGKGIYTTFKRSQDIPFTVGGIMSMTQQELEITLKKIAEYWEIEYDSTLLSEIAKYYLLFKQMNAFSFHAMNLEYYASLSDVCKKFGTIICEGSQGLLLDMDHGYAPHITPSRVGINGLPKILRQNAEVFLVTRAYLTRHGNGYVPKFFMDYDWSTEHESNVWNQYQGNFKRGLMELDLLDDAFFRHNLQSEFTKYSMTYNLVITHCDTVANYSAGKKRFLMGDNELLPDTASTPEDVADAIRAWLMTPIPDKLYYSDNWASDLKEITYKPIIP